MEFELMKEQLNGEYRKVFEAAWIYGIMKNVSNEMLIDRGKGCPPHCRQQHRAIL